MKIIFLAIFTASFLFAVDTLVVKEGYAFLLVNNEGVKVQKDQNLTLASGSKICFLAGDGIVLINSHIALLEQKDKCYTLPVKKKKKYYESNPGKTKKRHYRSMQIPPEETSAIGGEHDKIFYEKGNSTIVDILYATDRQANKTKNWEEYYGANRAKLQFGIAQVSIPKKHEFGEMERPNKYLFWEREKIGEHVMVVKLEGIDKDEFREFLGAKLNNVEEKDILIFIHGFNVTFASAIRRTAQLSYDLKFRGVPLTYSWPSAGETSAYMRDEASVQYTTPHLVAFLKEVIDHKEDANIHILGHSMGTRALTNAIKELSFLYPDRHIFKNIILAAPDIDQDVFATNLFPYIRKTTDQITLYASSDDAALKLSNTLHSGKRIGQGGDEIFVYEGLVTVDATGIDTSLLGHSYFAEKEILLGDLKALIFHSLPPSKRNLLLEKIKLELAYWKFKLEK